MNKNVVMRLFICAMFLMGSVAGASPPKVPEVSRSDLEGHSFLRLITPSGNIYHFKDDATLGNYWLSRKFFTSLILNIFLVLERKEHDQNEWKTLPFITFGPPYGTKYYIQFPADRAGFKLFEGTISQSNFCSIKIISIVYRNRQIGTRSRWSRF